MASHETAPARTPAVGHEVPWTKLLAVLIALLALTWLTIAAYWVDLGALNIWIAMGIATIKAALVVLYFMHLRYDRPFNAIVFVGTLAFVALFIGLTLADTREYDETKRGIWENSPVDQRTAAP